MDFDDVAVGVFHHALGGDEVGVAQADFLAGREAVVLGRRNFAEVVLLDVDFAGEGHLARAGGGVFGIVGDLDKLLLPFGVVVDDQLERAQHGHGARGAAVEVVALEVLEHFDVDAAVGARDADGRDEGADGFRRKAAAAKAGERGHARIVPAAHALLLHELEQLALAEQGVGEVEAVELDLLRGEDAELLDVPAVERLMVGELERAHGVGDVLDGIRLAVGVVVHGVDAPLVAGAVMRGVQDAVHDRVAHVEVGRGHVDLGAEHAASRRGTRRLSCA